MGKNGVHHIQCGEKTNLINIETDNKQLSAYGVVPAYIWIIE